ncbi:hypothetical protein B7494_g2813 [Chlorociboria aeruginascens]|nr:hypothetical protein B7494_g2813 [Chlorociboria aeruginascens]
MTSQYIPSRVSSRKTDHKRSARPQAVYLRKSETGQNGGRGNEEVVGDRDVDMNNEVQEDTIVMQVQPSARALHLIAFNFPFLGGIVIRGGKAALHMTLDRDVAEPVHKKRRHIRGSDQSQTSCAEQQDPFQYPELSLQCPLKRALDTAHARIETLESKNKALKYTNTALIMEGLNRPADELESYWKRKARSLEKKNKKLESGEDWTEYIELIESELALIYEENHGKERQLRKLRKKLAQVESERSSLLLNKTCAFVRGKFEDDDDDYWV